MLGQQLVWVEGHLLWLIVLQSAALTMDFKFLNTLQLICNQLSFLYSTFSAITTPQGTAHAKSTQKRVVRQLEKSLRAKLASLQSEAVVGEGKLWNAPETQLSCSAASFVRCFASIHNK